MAIKKTTAVVKKEVASKIKVGDIVIYDNEGDEIRGKVTEIEGKTATIEDDDNSYEIPVKDLVLVDKEEEEEEPAKKSKGKEEKPKGKGKGTSFGSLFNKAKPAQIAAGIPVGEWAALLTDAEADRKEEGLSCWLEFTVTDEGEAAGKSSRKYSFLTDADGEPAKGLNYFKTDLETLGYADLEIDEDSSEEEQLEQLNEILKDIAKQHLWVDIKVVARKDNPQYNNIYIQGLKDQDEKPVLDDIPMGDD